MTTSRKEALQVLATLRAAYPDAKIERETVELYVRLVADCDPAALRRAAAKHIATERWFPRVADLRAGVAADSVGNLPDPELAWERVLREVRRVGYARAPRFDVPAIADAVAAVGWESICMSTMIASERARFIDAYRAARGRAVREAQIGALAAAADAPMLPAPERK